MGTRAGIKFEDEHHNAIHVYRGHNGGPENVRMDIERTLDVSVGRWAGSEIGQLVALFLGMYYEQGERIQRYELTQGFHGDESYRYLVTWDRSARMWFVDVER